MVRRDISHRVFIIAVIFAMAAGLAAVPDTALAGDKVYTIRTPGAWETQTYADGTGGRTPQWMVDYGNKVMNTATTMAAGPNTTTSSYEFKAFQAEYIMGPDGQWKLVHRADYGGSGNLGSGQKRIQSGSSGKTGTNRTSSGSGGRSSSSPSRGGGSSSSSSSPGSTPGSSSSSSFGGSPGFAPYDLAALPPDAIPIDPNDPESSSQNPNSEAVASGSVPNQDLNYIKIGLEEIGIGKSLVFTSANGAEQKYDVREDTRVKLQLLPEFVDNCVPESVKINISEYQQVKQLDPAGSFPFETALLFRTPTDNYSLCYIEVFADPKPGKTVVPLKLWLRISDMSMQKGTLLDE